MLVFIFYELLLSRMHMWRYHELKYSMRCLTYFTISAKRSTCVRGKIYKRVGNLQRISEFINNEPYTSRTALRENFAVGTGGRRRGEI